MMTLMGFIGATTKPNGGFDLNFVKKLIGPRFGFKLLNFGSEVGVRLLCQHGSLVLDYLKLFEYEKEVFLRSASITFGPFNTTIGS